MLNERGFFQVPITKYSPSVPVLPIQKVPVASTSL